MKEIIKYNIRYRTNIGTFNNKTIEANSKLEAMKIFNNKYRFYNVEIIEVTEENKKLKGEIMNQAKETHITLEEYKDLKQVKEDRLNNLSNMLEQTNTILFEQLQKIKDIDSEDKDKAELEISKNNAVAGTGKVLIQSIGLQMMVEKQKGIM